MFAVASAIAAEHDHAFAGVIARSPKPIALVVADRFRQPVFFPEEIDRARLPVTVGKDRRLRALLRRKLVVDARNFLRHFLPAKFIGEMLRQRPGRLVLGLRRLEADRLLVADIRCRRQHRRHRRRKDAGGRHNENGVNHAAPSGAFARRPFQRHSARREKHRIRGRQVVVLSLQRDEGDEQEEVNPTKNAIAAPVSICE